MSEGLIICRICLRVDIKLREIDKRLKEFHDELCDFSVEVSNPLYCSECEHLLKKSYNFRNKCIRSMKLLKAWKKNKSPDKKLQNLHALLPPSPLGPWSANKSIIFLSKFDQQVKEESSGTQHPQLINNVIKLCSSKIRKIGHIEIDTKKIKEESNSVELPIIPNKAVIVQSNETQEELTVNAVEEENKPNVGSLFYYLLPKNPNAVSEPVVKKFKLKLDNTEVSNEAEHNYSINDQENRNKINKIKLDESESFKNEAMEYEPVKKEEKQEIDGNGAKNDGYVYYDYLDDNFLYSEDIEETNEVVVEEHIVTNDEDQEMIQLEDVDDDDADEKPEVSDDVVVEFYQSEDNIESDEEFNINDMDIISNKTINRDKLKAEINSLFWVSGDLADDEGNEIDKEYVLSCLDDKVSEFMWRRLWKAVHRQDLTTRAIQLFNLIQTHCKLDAEIQNCEVEYLNTTQKVIEEFKRRKHYEWYLNAKYKCDICFIPYNYEQILNTHMRHHYNTEGEYSCSLCQLRYTKRNELLKHMHNHEVIYKCQLCPMATYYRSSMQTHSYKHQGKQYQCGQCDTTFNCLSWYYKHVARAHARSFVCTICADAFFSKDKLTAHQLRHEAAPQEEGDGVQCDMCELVFPSLEVYQKHVKISHNTTTRKRRQRKEKSEEGRKYPTASLMSCRVPGCELRGYYGTLVYHFRTEHPDVDMELLYADTKKHLCEICGTGYTSQYHLRYHMNKHLGVLPYECTECQKRFHSPQALKHHSLLHAPRSKPCAVCGKLFRTTSNLYNHMRFHLQDRRYKCGICGKGFMHRNSLNEHIRGVHHHVRRVRKRENEVAERRDTDVQRKADTKTKVTEELIRGILEARTIGVADGVSEVRARDVPRARGIEARAKGVSKAVMEANRMQARGARVRVKPRFIEAAAYEDVKEEPQYSSDYDSERSSDNEI